MTDEATVERVARAIYEAGIPKGGKYYHTWDDLESDGFYAQHDLAMKQASAAIAALPPQGDGMAELRAPLTRDLPEKNEDVWAAGMNAIRDMLCDLERDDFKDIGNGYPAAIWAAMYDAAELKKGK